MANNEQIRKLIRQIVREEVQKSLPSMLSEVFAGIITEGIKNNRRRNINEASYGAVEEMDDYPTMARAPMDRSRMATLMGYGDVPPSARNHMNEMIVTSAHTENGTPIPIDPNTVPDHVVDALTKNYGEFMKVLNDKVNSKRGG